jgi:hypothetical protein
VSLDEIHDLREKFGSMSERLARMEERQITLIGMVERSLSSFGDLSNRVTSLEHLKTKMLLVAGSIGAIVSVVWDAIRSRLTNGG